MKLILERTKFEPTYKNGLAVSWEIAFELQTEDGAQSYTPITIYRQDVPSPVTEASVTIRAFMEVIPSQLFHILKDSNIVDEMDVIAEQLLEEEKALLVDTNTTKNEKTKVERQSQLDSLQKRIEKLKEEPGGTDFDSNDSTNS
jgi:hypothetical protein